MTNATQIIGSENKTLLIGAAQKLGFGQSFGFTGLSFYKGNQRIADHGISSKWAEKSVETVTILVIHDKMTIEEASNALNEIGLNYDECMKLGAAEIGNQYMLNMISRENDYND